VIKQLKKEQVLEVHVQKGMKPGHKVTFREAADQAPGAEPGDVVVILLERSEPKEKEGKDGKKKPRVDEDGPIVPSFKRVHNGEDLLMEHEMNLAEALLGFEFSFRHLDQRIVIVKSPEGKTFSPSDLLIVEGEGMPQQKNPVFKGDLYIKLNLNMPTAKDLADESVRKQLAALLPPSQPLPEGIKTNSEVQHYTATPFDAEQAEARAQRNREKTRNHYEEDDDEHQGPTTQCRQQ